MNQVVKAEPTTPAQAGTPFELLERAVTSGATPEALKTLMDLQERWEKNQARKAFDSAIADAKAEIKPVVKNREGHNNKRYADFAAVARAIDPILSKHGLSYRFRSETGDKINVTCILSHKGGHSEETTLSGPADTTGSKNAIQAIGSTLTYLQRYTLMQAVGLAASEDTDGAEVVSDDQADELRNLAIETKANMAAFLKYIGAASIADIPAKRFADAKAALEAKRKPVPA